MSDIITFEELQQATGYKQPRDIVAHLAREGVECFIGLHGRPYTLSTLFLVAKGVSPERTTAAPTPGSLTIRPIK